MRNQFDLFELCGAVSRWGNQHKVHSGLQVELHSHLATGSSVLDVRPRHTLEEEVFDLLPDLLVDLIHTLEPLSCRAMVLPQPEANTAWVRTGFARCKITSFRIGRLLQFGFCHRNDTLSLCFYLFWGDHVFILVSGQSSLISIFLQKGLALRDRGLSQGEVLAHEKIPLKTVEVASIRLLDRCRVEAALPDHHLVRDAIHAHLRNESLDDNLGIVFLGEIIDVELAVVALDGRSFVQVACSLGYLLVQVLLQILLD